MKKLEKTLTFGELCELYLQAYNMVKVYTITNVMKVLYFSSLGSMPIQKYFELKNLLVNRMYPDCNSQAGAHLCVCVKGAEENE